ncbi:hypothetical protein COU80_02650 [Candidatus Peregrinibacteria bacterium CG10_big_fil_rev_8_21_14_0_10_55_24]|nr:MAG: hypothetical protein COU80_02650 [Candidatus Peregrinibacteria bacterium CG10_big_fil_rev_8_21_14_0_10_55_24]
MAEISISIDRSSINLKSYRSWFLGMLYNEDMTSMRMQTTQTMQGKIRIVTLFSIPITVEIAITLTA